MFLLLVTLVAVAASPTWAAVEEDEDDLGIVREVLQDRGESLLRVLNRG
jgi:hypothetical protein